MGLSIGLVIVASIGIVSVMAWSNPRMMERLILIPPRVVNRGEYYRLLTAGWIHGDGTHLIFNLLSLYFFAASVEQAIGALRFVMLYVAAVVVGFVPTVLRHRNHGNYRSLGASGGVAATIFSAILLDPRLSMYLMFIPIPIPGWLFGLGYLAYSAYSSRKNSDNVNHDAHFTGAIAGVLLTFALAPTLVVRGLRMLVA